MNIGNLSSIYTARKTIIEQCKSFNYNVKKYENFNLNDVNTMSNTSNLDMIFDEQNDSTNNNYGKRYIMFKSEKNLKQNDVYNIIDEIYNYDEILQKETDYLLIITKDDPNDEMNELLRLIWNTEKIFINIMSIKRLQFNILEHEYVPQHRIMDKDESDEFIEKYNINEPTKQIPEISRFDPVAIIIGLKPNQLCEITRKSETAITSNYYRICI